MSKKRKGEDDSGKNVGNKSSKSSLDDMTRDEKQKFLTDAAKKGKIAEVKKLAKGMALLRKSDF